MDHVDTDLKAYANPAKMGELANKIDEGVPYASNLILMLSGNFLVKAISAWFHENDLNQLKDFFYNNGKLQYIYLTSFGYDPSDKVGSYPLLALEGMYFLVSDNPGLIRWYATLDARFETKKANNPKIFDYWTAQLFPAIRGEWDTLGERCERILAEPPKASSAKQFMIDHEFYLALAKGNSVEMERIIAELVTPKRIYQRRSLESGYTQDLLCTPAILYSKLAWRHGYEIVVDSPYIPKQWLPISPLEHYVDPFLFMKEHPF